MTPAIFRFVLRGAVALAASASLAAPLAAPLAAAPASAAGPRLLVRVSGAGDDAGRLDLVGAASGQLLSSLPLRCDRVHNGAAVIACLRIVPGQGMKLDLADRQARVTGTLSFPNVLMASRVRVSPDGAVVALTGFSAGHTYIGTDFSTRTYLVDAVKRRVLADVSMFKVIEADGLSLAARRINVWGITFDPKLAGRFLATVGAGGGVFLAAGDIKARTLTLMRADMECPSLSPDGRKVAFKRRNGAGGWWPAVYELATGREWVMKDSRSIDDQIEWIDEATIAYELAQAGSGDLAGTDVIVRKADGSGTAAALRKNAGSPSLFR